MNSKRIKAILNKISIANKTDKENKMYILVLKSKFAPLWHLVSHTGLVLARSDRYKRTQDAVRVGKQVAKQLDIEFKYE